MFIPSPGIMVFQVLHQSSSSILESVHLIMNAVSLFGITTYNDTGGSREQMYLVEGLSVLQRTFPHCCSGPQRTASSGCEFYEVPLVNVLRRSLHELMCMGARARSTQFVLLFGLVALCCLH